MYAPPETYSRCYLKGLLPSKRPLSKEIPIYASGDLPLLDRPVVSIIGSRNASDLGRRNAKRLAEALAREAFVIMSGLAVGIDTAAMEAALAAGGRVIGVIGTSLEEAYPAVNAELQERVYREGLLISPFSPESPVSKGNFPFRNRVMAAASDVTVVLEAGERSGTRHQVKACVEMGRKVFLHRKLSLDPYPWVAEALEAPTVAVLTDSSQVLEAARSFW